MSRAAGQLSGPIHALLEHAQIVLFAVDRACVFTLYEGKEVGCLPFESAEVIGRPANQIFGDLPWLLDDIHGALEGRPAARSALFGRFGLETQCVPLRDSAGRIVGVAGYVVDVTERRLAEEQLRASEQRFRQLARVTFEGVAIHDKGKILLANHSFAAMLGYDEDEIIGRNVLDFATPESRAEVARRYMSGDENVYQAWGLRKDGSRFAAELHGRAVPFEGRMVRVTAFHDISDRKRTEATLAEVEARLRSIVEHAPLVLFSLDRTGRITLVEGKGLKALGVESSQLVGRPVLELEYPMPWSRAEMERVLAGEELTVVADVADRWYETFWTPLRDLEGEAAAIGVSFDISERKRAEDEQAYALERAEAARLIAETAWSQSEEALRSREEFLSVASHELRTPLTALQLQVQKLREMIASAGLDRVSPEVVARSLQTAERQTKRLTKLVEDLLDVSRLTTGRLPLRVETADLSAIVREVVMELEPAIARVGSTLKLTADESVIGQWDALRLAQVVNNLLSNAIRYGGGKPIEVSVSAESGRARLVVRDQGIGIAREKQLHIFDRFQRGVSARHYGGLGLGLFIVRSIVDALGGSVEVQSEIGEGATFTVDLPFTPPPHPGGPAV
jgi:PAS domain S-box-containing protein